MMRNALRRAFDEPAVPGAPIRVWRDYALIGAFTIGALVELAIREAAGPRPLGAFAMVVAAGALWWRRSHPLAATVAVFGFVFAADLVLRATDRAPLEFYSLAVVLVVAYALFRWGSGRSAVIGLLVMLATALQSIVISWTGPGDAIGGILVLLFPAALGDIVRYQAAARGRSLEEVKLREREQLARELHDTVAHHVSAIAIQAQAGRAVAATDPAAALAVLATIEQEASRTLAEMRTMVGALRAGEEAELTPQSGVADIERLAERSARLPITVHTSGDLAELSPSVDRALFRLAQESITNATRHARNATGVTVSIDADQDRVRLSVVDDGEPRGFDAKHDVGFGLVGMAERASLLGGTLEAGPNPRSWLDRQRRAPEAGGRHERRHPGAPGRRSGTRADRSRA